MSDAVYLYGFVQPAVADPPTTLAGISGRRVELVDLGGVRAAVSSVPAEAFAPERMEERVHDLEWVGEQGALHERVVTWFVDHGGIVPVRLLTLYSTAGALRDSVEGQRDVLARQLERLRDLREWDLKVSYDPHALADHLQEVSEEVARLQQEIDQSSPGRRYLLERKRSQLVTEETSRIAGQLAADLHAKLGELSREARRLPIPRERSDLPVVLSGAYLVELGREGDLGRVAAQEVARLGPLGLDARLTGPWAPYRFLDAYAPGDAAHP
jgi:hypothetical protein